MNTTNQTYPRRSRFFFIFFLIIGLFSISAVLMFLWNWIIPAISTLSPLTYWQAMGLLILCKILFGGFRFHRHHGDHRPHFMPAEAREKFMNMNDEEKQEFKNQWKKRCCR